MHIAMDYTILGRTGLKVSRVSFGASSLGGVFRAVEETQAIRAVHTALDLGINYFDVAPAYGGTRSETVLGKALKGIPRDRYFLSTKAGKYTNPEKYGDDTFDYSEARIRASLDESASRLGTDFFDIIHLHDIEYQGRKHTEWALEEGLPALQQLKREGRIGAVGCGIYPVDLWHRILTDYEIDAALIHNHYCLNDTRLLELLPAARSKNIGVINGSPFGRGPADWHSATADDRSVFKKAAELCKAEGTLISKLAFQFASQNPEIPTTLFSSGSAESVKKCFQWFTEPYDPILLERVRKVLSPVFNKQWEASENSVILAKRKTRSGFERAKDVENGRKGDGRTDGFR